MTMTWFEEKVTKAEMGSGQMQRRRDGIQEAEDKRKVMGGRDMPPMEIWNFSLQDRVRRQEKEDKRYETRDKG